MSDLISRLAARAVAPGADARPRVRSRFEPSSTGGPGPGGIDAEHAAASDGPELPGDAGEHRSWRGVDGPHDEARLPPAGRRGSAPRPLSASTRRVDASAPRAGAAGLDAALPSDRGHGLVRAAAPSTTPATRPPDGSPRGTRRTASMPIGAASPGLPVRARPTAASPLGGRVDPHIAPSESTPAGPVVRIHIGRLDVRANLQAAPPPAASEQGATDRGERGLSLPDYLAGRRSAP